MGGENTNFLPSKMCKVFDHDVSMLESSMFVQCAPAFANAPAGKKALIRGKATPVLPYRLRIHTVINCPEVCLFNCLNQATKPLFWKGVLQRGQDEQLQSRPLAVISSRGCNSTPIYKAIYGGPITQGTMGCTPNRVPMVFIVFSGDSWGL